jgi:apolipoprotein N-acyltransferase
VLVEIARQTKIKYRNANNLTKPSYLVITMNTTMERPHVRIALALLSSLLITLSFPNADHGWLAWVALVPLLLAIRGIKAFPAFALGMLSGIGGVVGIYHWMFQLPEFGVHHALLLAPYLGSYTALWCLVVSRLKYSSVSVALTAPALWVMLEYARSHAGFLALPWATLAHSQHDNLALLQLAAATGEYGISYIVVLANVLLAGMVSSRKMPAYALPAIATIAAVHLGGLFVLNKPDANLPSKKDSADNTRITVVQPSILVKEATSDESDRIRWQRLEALTRHAVLESPELIVWPESAVRDLTGDPRNLDRLQGLAESTNTSLLIGVSDSEKFFPVDGQSPDAHLFNAAYLVRPDRSISKPYYKNLLVPFGEYVPLSKSFDWPKWLVPEISAMQRGVEQGLFVLEKGVRIAPLICWENLFSDYVRMRVQNGATLLVQLSNNNWFGASAQPRQHNLASVLRAVENGVSVVIASNTGPSQFIGPDGRTVAQSRGLFSQENVTSRVPIGTGMTFYTRFSDVFFLSILATMTFVGLTLYFWRDLRDS